MKKLLTILFCLVLFLTGCTGAEQPVEKTPILPAELVGTWEMTGIVYDGKMVDIDSVDGLRDLYDLVFLSLNEDGSFLYLNTFTYKGDAEEYHLEGAETPVYLMKIKTSSRIHKQEDGEIVNLEKAYEGNPYILTQADENTIIFAPYDEDTGKMDELPFVMTRSES